MLNTEQYRGRMPDATLETMALYVREGIRTGSFCEAVLSNDLFGAFARADEGNRAAIGAIVEFVYNETPMHCHGSPEHYSQWVAAGDANRADGNGGDDVE